jgi:hypothetical protein
MVNVSAGSVGTELNAGTEKEKTGSEMQLLVL